MILILYILDEEWGDEDEWEWEADEEIEQENSTKISKIPSPPPPPVAPTKTVNGINGIVNGSSAMNGHKSNGYTKTSGVINHEDQEIEEVNGKADIKIEGNLLTIKRNGPIDWSDDEYEDDEEETDILSLAPPPAPPAPPPPPPVPPPPPPSLPAGNFCKTYWRLHV